MNDKKAAPLLKVTEVAEELGVCPSTVRTLITTGKLSAVRVGLRLFRVERKALDAFVTSSSSPCSATRARRSRTKRARSA